MITIHHPHTIKKKSACLMLHIPHQKDGLAGKESVKEGRRNDFFNGEHEIIWVMNDFLLFCIAGVSFASSSSSFQQEWIGDYSLIGTEALLRLVMTAG